jgi:Ca2+-binding RTX toxin-like protein
MTTTNYPNGVTFTVDTVIATGDEILAPLVAVSSNGTRPTLLTNRGTLTIGSPSAIESLGVIVGDPYDGLAGFVNEGVVRSTGGGGHEVYGVFTYSTLTTSNSGLIESHNLAGRAIGIFSDYGGPIENSGRIEVTSDSGEAFGIWALVGVHRIDNSGALIVRGGSTVDPIGVVGIRNGGSWGATIVNSGTIDVASSDSHQDSVGIYMFPNADNIHTFGTIINSGTISAKIAVRMDEGYATGLHLQNSGVIIGDLLLNHNFNIVNNDIGASWTGHLQFGFNDDILLNAGAIAGVADLGGGDDIYDSHDGGTVQAVHAGAGFDVLLGGAEVDQFDGGSDSDYIYGGGGADVLTGGGGSDIFVYRMASDSIAAAGDTITDFVSGQDLIDLSALAPTDVALSPQGSGQLLTAHTANGTLTIQISGTIATTDILFGSLPTAVEGTPQADLLRAGDQPSTLNGMAGDDLLLGGAGADHLDGGTGADRSYGGAGDDSYFVDDLYDRIYEAPDQGLDTVFSTASYTLLSDNIESLYLLAGAADGAGNNSDNLIVGNDLNNSLWSGGGVDRLYGGRGNDTYYIDRTDDLVFEEASAGVDTVHAASNFYLYDNIENLTLETAAAGFATLPPASPGIDFFGVGNALDNQIIGNTGNNLLLGGGGSDTITGGNGNDSIFGESGNDTLYGNEGIDYIDGGDGNDLIYGGNGADALYGGAGDDHLIGHREYIRDQITGLDTVQSDFSTDILVGGDGNDILDGASGLGDYDLMDGGAGDDAYYVDTPADLTFEAVGGGADTVYANIKGAGYYLYANVENLVLQGNTPFGVGNELDNHLTGNDVGNYLLGGAGNDVLNGKGGNDVLFGESGADTFVFEHGTGGDVIGDFLAGTDKIDLSAFGFANYQTVVNSMHEVNGTTAIDLGGGDFIVLNGVAEASLHAGDFILGASSQSAQHDSANSPIVAAGFTLMVPHGSEAQDHSWSAVLHQAAIDALY